MKAEGIGGDSLIKLISFIRGYVNIIVDGYFTERFINMCVNSDILLWDIKRLGENRIVAKIMPGDFHKIRNAARKTKSTVRISEKKGLPFLMFRYRKRKIAVVGIVICFAMFAFFSSHVMGIDITGNERVSKEKIITSLKDFGIYTCAPLKGIDRKLVQNKMMTRFEDISWIGINIRGSRVYIEVKERLDTKEGVALDKPCDLVAKEDGIIDELKVREGQSLVKVKEFVEKGDLLVSGAMDSTKLGIRYVHSYGEIYAITQRNLSRDYPLEYIEKIQTGQEKTKYIVSILGKKFNLFIKKEPEYKLYEKNESEKEYIILKNVLPSLYIKKITYKELKEKKINVSEKEAFEKGKEEISEEIKKNLSKDTEIKNISSKYEKSGEKSIKVTVNFELRENIAEERAIDKIENLNYDIVDSVYNSN